MSALIIRLYYLLKDHMGTHFSVYVRAHCPKGREKYGKLVQWTEELPCFAHERKEQGSVIFFIALRITSLQVQG